MIVAHGRIRRRRTQAKVCAKQIFLREHSLYVLGLSIGVPAASWIECHCQLWVDAKRLEKILAKL